MQDQIQLLIDILLDKNAREDERSDAAIDLGIHKDPRALQPLIEVASNPKEDDTILDNCAESIGEIFIGMNQFNEHFFRKITPYAQKIVFHIVMARNPNLIDKELITELKKNLS